MRSVSNRRRQLVSSEAPFPRGALGATNNMRLNGWIRIGVVLSIAWMVGGTAHFWVEEQSRVRSYYLALSERMSDCVVGNTVRRSMREPEAKCITEQELRDARSSGHPIYFDVFVAAVWLAVAWVAIGIVYVAVRWIRKGFQQA